MTAGWGWEQWTIAGVYGFAAVVSVLGNGVPRTGKNNGALGIICIAGQAYILWSGGFFQ